MTRVVVKQLHVPPGEKRMLNFYATVLNAVPLTKLPECVDIEIDGTKVIVRNNCLVPIDVKLQIFLI